MSVRKCPNCGNEINDNDIEFCTECGYSLSGNLISKENDSKGFFDDVIDKTSFSIVIFAFVVFGIFLFIGSFVWGSFMSLGSIDFVTYCILTIVFAVFFAGMFIGYFGCKDKSYVIPNFWLFLASIYAVVLTIFGLAYTFLGGFISFLGSSFGSGASTSSEPLTPTAASSSAYSPAAPSIDSSIFLSLILKIIMFILAVPIAAYFGVYLGYFLKENI